MLKIISSKITLAMGKSIKSKVKRIAKNVQLTKTSTTLAIANIQSAVIVWPLASFDGGHTCFKLTPAFL